MCRTVDLLKNTRLCRQQAEQMSANIAQTWQVPDQDPQDEADLQCMKDTHEEGLYHEKEEVHSPLSRRRRYSRDIKRVRYYMIHLNMLDSI